MDAALKDALKVETFKFTEFDTKSLIELASRKPLSELRTNAFDPKPFIRSFDGLTEELLRIKRKLQNKIEDQEDQLTSFDNSKRRAFKEFNDSYDEIFQSYESLNSKLGEVGNTAVRIGEQLETIDKHRTRAAEAKDLIQYFLEFNRGQFGRLDDLRKESQGGEYLAAVIARRLNTIAKEIDLPGTEAARANIEKYCENFEKSLLSNFDQVYANADRETMHHIATTLIAFNGGNSVIQTYVNQHPFFINLLKIVENNDLEPIGSTTKWAALKMNALKRLYEEIRVAVVNEWDVIYDVFPNASSVIQVFVQRIFAQSIQNFIEVLMQEALEKSAQIYLEVLTQSHRETADLVSDMHNFDESVISPLLGGQALGSIMDRSIEDLYVPYVDEERYINAEKAWLKENFELELRKFNEGLEAFHAGTKKSSRGKNQNAPPPKDPTASSIVVSNLFSTVTTTVNTMTAELKSQLAAPVNAPDPALANHLIPSLDVATRFIKCTHQSFERASELCRPQELSEILHSLLELLIDSLGYEYLDTAADLVINKMNGGDSKSEPDFGQFAIIKVSNQIVQLLQLHFQTYESKILHANPKIHRDMVMMKNEFISALESKLNGIIQKRISAILSWVELLLSRQKKTDYNLKEGLLENTVSTASCNMITNFLRHVTDEAFDSLDDRNRDAYFVEIGTSLCKLLLDHIKRFYYTYSGGLVLSTDITRFHEVIIQFRVESLNEYFSVLKELSNIYIVKPENLKMVLQEGYLGRMELSVLHSYLVLRSDWSKLIRIEKDLFQWS